MLSRRGDIVLFWHYAYATCVLNLITQHRTKTVRCANIGRKSMSEVTSFSFIAYIKQWCMAFSFYVSVGSYFAKWHIKSSWLLTIKQCVYLVRWKWIEVEPGYSYYNSNGSWEIIYSLTVWKYNIMVIVCIYDHQGIYQDVYMRLKIRIILECCFSYKFFITDRVAGGNIKLGWQHNVCGMWMG